MIDRTLARGLFLAMVALAFGLGALQYPLGRVGNAGPGLFPLVISCLLGLVALVTIIRSRFDARAGKGEPLAFQVRNIGLLLSALTAFALVSKFVNMTLGIVVMVFIASVAASKFSWVRSVKIAAGLVAVAFAFHKLLGLNLPLY